MVFTKNTAILCIVLSSFTTLGAIFGFSMGISFSSQGPQYHLSELETSDQIVVNFNR